MAIPATPGAFTKPTGTLRSDFYTIIEWGSSPDAASYELTYALNGGTFGNTKFITAPAVSYNLKIPACTTIQFRVRAYNAGTYSIAVFSSTFNVSINNPPTAPGAFISPVGNTIPKAAGIRLEWGESLDKDGDYITYYIDRSVNGGAYSFYTFTPGTYLTIDFSNDVIGNKYIYRVVAHDGGVYGGYTYSNEYTIVEGKIQIGTYPLMGKNSIINIPLYDPASVTVKCYRAFTASGKIGCFDVQDITGTELIRVMGKTKIRGIKR